MATIRAVFARDALYAETDPRALRAAMADAIAATPLVRLYLLRSTVRDDGPRRTGVARITMVLKGTRQIVWPEGGRITEHRLRAGEAILVEPRSWSRPAAKQSAHRYLSIDCYPDFTRYICEHWAARDGAGPASRRVRQTAHPQDGAYYAPAPASAACRHLLQAIFALETPGAAAALPKGGTAGNVVEPMSDPVGDPIGEPVDEPLEEALFQERSTAIGRCFLAEILRGCGPTGAAVHPARLQWRRAVCWAREHIDPELSRERMAAAVGVHPNHLSRLCKRFTGGRLGAFLTALRIERAQALLTDPALPVREVVALAGYRDETHFRKRFKAITGRTPGTYRRETLQPSAPTGRYVPGDGASIR